MIWKILSAILTIVLVVSAINVSNTILELRILKSEISSMAGTISSQDIIISQLQSSQSSTADGFNTQIWELQNALDKIGVKYPIIINEITFNNFFFYSLCDF